MNAWYQSRWQLKEKSRAPEQLTSEEQGGEPTNDCCVVESHDFVPKLNFDVWFVETCLGQSVRNITNM